MSQKVKRMLKYLKKKFRLSENKNLSYIHDMSKSMYQNQMRENNECLTSNNEIKVRMLEMLRNQIDFQIENKIMQLIDSRDALMDEINNYEMKCLTKNNEFKHFNKFKNESDDELVSVLTKSIELVVNNNIKDSNSKFQVYLNSRPLKRDYQQILQTRLNEIDLSNKDSLTGLFNRRFFDHYIEKLKKISNSSFCLIMIDFDNLKKINDTYGHLAGDEVLKTLANILKSSVRVTDCVIRYGGDEFMIFLNDTNIKDAWNVAEQLRKQVELTNFYIPEYNTPIKNTISVGVTEYLPLETSISLIRRVDKALYQAKNDGRNKVVHALAQK